MIFKDNNRMFSFAPVDVTDEGSVRDAIQLATTELGPLTAAVNCAGIATGALTYSKRGV